MASGSRATTPQVLLQTGLEDTLLGSPIQTVVTDLDHAGADLASAPDLMEVVTGEGEAEVPDRAPGHLLVERLPEAVVVDDLVGPGMCLVEVDVVGPKGPQRPFQLRDHVFGRPVIAADVNW